MRRSGMTTLSTSAWDSIPNGPSARVEHTISGPFTNRNESSAASSPRSTASFEFGLTTRIRRWGRFIGLLAGGFGLAATSSRYWAWLHLIGDACRFRRCPDLEITFFVASAVVA